ncbi:zinc finger BED domain-containing protein 6-like isoform X1 [Hemicordylus capensis]|uniref:zinc finger BED domain-containing protein 6-like isoform X1 n=1 Tax=Hemicordylus capensis TaxID=884348 RepID=UPI002304B2EE|nr:zinc finger BED domain-containing protein 6-like isoform X1 [Hemicordylus capensis]XP_053104189.1 zinc finger BED domain-containing protein 6-like isoform X1 [Hemicordylus capensis]
MRRFSDSPEEASNPEAENLCPCEQFFQDLAAYAREQGHIFQPEVPPEGRESPLTEFELPAVLNVLPEEEDLFCLLNPPDAIPVSCMHPSALSLPGSSSESCHGSDGGPTLHYTSASASSAAFLGHQSGQALPPAEHAASDELALEHNISRAIEQDLKKSLCPVVHFSIDVWSTGPATGYMFIIAHWLVDNDGILHRHRAMMAVCEAQKNNLTEIICHRLKVVRDKWLYPLQLEVGYVVTLGTAAAKAVKDSCLGYILSPNLCLYQLIKAMMVNYKDVLIGWLREMLHKISIHFEQSLVAQDRLKELQLLSGLPQEFLEEEMPKDLYLLMRFLIARQRAFRTYQEENPGLNFRYLGWCLMYHLVCLLKPFEEAIMTIRNENANLGQVLHEVHSLESKVKDHLQQLQQELNVTVVAAATRFAHELLQALESSQDLGRIKEHILHQTATFLHPCFRDHISKYLNGDVESEWEQLKKWVIWQTEKEYMRNLSSDYAASSLTERASLELESYLQDKIDPTQLDLDPLFYWNSKRHTWPCLSVVALQYCSCPPTPFLLQEVHSIEDLMILGSFQERHAFNRLNQDWMAAELRVPSTSTDTGSESVA